LEVGCILRFERLAAFESTIKKEHPDGESTGERVGGAILIAASLA